ncbi:DUF4352 domain-containing protein [Listeria swaminathanii]|uniref:DUF4352 domain-containing protein n=1 Tax=Listeria swaminathanii TaxID=2713501 RepID=A0A7X1A1U7_9LIST|nr:DUF4352 domain-containing protein [Listeria swaminathanii]MCD2247421.1 DUF4352 domain-containing protein [Listeria marthii]MBC2329587.1 DUF4352 domain-containing protein [Listeria swaminathanii]MDT0016743.1 DUF4352 domain-containing protein [Listeria swaminathanii]MDT0022179.1 DUF4352 domain-containing protein [Listeria swaminathanii]MDT0033143.1 DUF4352 domain-containing protein [Listeria swaminathanii]
MDMLLILLISLFTLTFIGVVVGIILLIVRKERWAGIIVTGLSFGLGFCVLLAGLNVATATLFEASNNPFSIYNYDAGEDLYANNFEEDYDEDYYDDYTDVNFGEAVTIENGSTVTISKPELSQKKEGYEIYKVKVKFENTGSDAVMFYSEDVSLYDDTDDDYGQQITEDDFSGEVQPGEAKEITLYYEVFNSGPYDVEYDNYNWTE